MNDDLTQLAAKVRTARMVRGWSQKDLADQAGVYFGTIGNFERGKSFPQPDHLRAILRALDLEGEGGDDMASASRREWPSNVRIFLDMMGLYLTALDEDDQTAVMHDITQQIVNR